MEEVTKNMEESSEIEITDANNRDHQVKVCYKLGFSSRFRYGPLESLSYIFPFTIRSKVQKLINRSIAMFNIFHCSYFMFRKTRRKDLVL